MSATTAQSLTPLIFLKIVNFYGIFPRILQLLRRNLTKHNKFPKFGAIEAAKQGKEPKAPCYFDGKRVIPINWKQWQKDQPIAEIYNAWFSNPKTGIGTLGGWNGKHWLGWVDFDQKDFSSPLECDAKVAEWVEQYPVMADAPMFRTPSGGYRFLVAFSREPENFKANSGFSLRPDGSHHVGELLSKNGGHTLLPPTVGVSGKAYRWERWSEYPQNRPPVLAPLRYTNNPVTGAHRAAAYLVRAVQPRRCPSVDRESYENNHQGRALGALDEIHLPQYAQFHS